MGRGAGRCGAVLFRFAARAVSVFLAFALTITLCSCGGFDYRGEGLLTVHYLDVGQSDCTFIEVGGEYTLMIDASDTAHADKVCSYIRSLGYREIDALVLTHPHSDHIGGAPRVIESFDVKRVYMTEEESSEPEYAELIEAVKKHSPERIEAEGGVGITLGALSGEFLSTGGVRFEDENDMSAILSLCYGSVSFLFMGDAGHPAEEALLGGGADVSATVVKAGHHGSNGSSSEAFVKAAGAAYVIFSCGTDNDYGHPSVYAVDRWERSGARSFRTDIDSTVVVCTDGQGIAAGSLGDSEYWENAALAPAMPVTDSGKADPTQNEYILDTETHTVHVPACGEAMRLQAEKKEISNADIRRLCAEGYRKCRCLG